MKPLLSIAIATKNREIYCIEVIKSILDWNDSRVEICISDNSSTKKIYEFLSFTDQANIRYDYTNDAISSIDNFNRALDLATGEYICLLGDDDGVLPEVLKYLEWAKENNIDSFCSKEAIPYFWPGAHPDFPNGGMFVKKHKDGIRKVDAKKELIKLLKNGIVNYMFFDLPKSYHGFVKRDIMLKIKDITGNFYGGLSPDIFSVVAISLLSKNHYTVDKPLTIGGVCRQSTTADQISGAHCGPLEKMPHLQNRKIPYQWDKDVPEFYSVTTTWGDSGLNSIGAMNKSEYRKYFNIYPLLAQAILMNRNQIFKLMMDKVEELRVRKKIGKIKFWTNMTWAVGMLCMEKSNRILKDKIINKNVQIQDVKDIHDAIGIYTNKTK